MKNTLHLTASFDQPELLEDIVQKLADRRYDLGYGTATVPKSWKAVETSTTETFADGTVEFDYDEDTRVRIPFITRFLFTCIKEDGEQYKLNWGLSLN